MDSAELIKLQAAVEQLVIAQEGDQEYAQPFNAVTMAQSTNSIQFAAFSPPVDSSDTEFIPQTIVVMDLAGIDSLDRIQVRYQDVITNISFPIFSLRGSAFTGITPAGNVWSWPMGISPPQPNVADISIDYQPLRLFRRVNGEAWRRLLFDASTTATVGTRSFQGHIVYRKRPTTRV